MKTRKYLRLIMTYSALIVFTCAILFPIIWVVSVSLKPDSEIYAWPPKLLPSTIDWSHFKTVLFESNIPQSFLNSIKVASISAITASLFSILAGYALSRFKFFGKSTVITGIMAAQIFPAVVLILPFYIFWNWLGLLGTHLPLIICYMGIFTPIGAWLLTGFFEAVPKELEEVAAIDGCSRIGALFRIVFPLMKAPIFSVFLFLFIAMWNEYMLALTFINEESMKTICIGVLSFRGQYRTNWGSIMAAATLASLPILIIFAFFQKYFIKGLAKGAVKG